MTQSQVLKHLIEKSKVLSAQQERFAVAIDLDSTLYNVAPRMNQIIKDFCAERFHREKHPNECSILEKTEHKYGDWGLEVSMQRAGINIQPSEFMKDIMSFWQKCFFSNEYLHYDEPMPGAIDYVQSLHNAGAYIFYLTGRDSQRLGHGTRECLEKFDFPLHDKTAKIALKPNASLKDETFKQEYLNSLEKLKKEIWLIENEPVNINLILEKNPKIQILFFDSVHSGREDVPENIKRITNFLIEEDS